MEQAMKQRHAFETLENIRSSQARHVSHPFLVEPTFLLTTLFFSLSDPCHPLLIERSIPLDLCSDRSRFS